MRLAPLPCRPVGGPDKPLHVPKPAATLGSRGLTVTRGRGRSRPCGPTKLCLVDGVEKGERGLMERMPAAWPNAKRSLSGSSYSRCSPKGGTVHGICEDVMRIDLWSAVLVLGLGAAAAAAQQPRENLPQGTSQTASQAKPSPAVRIRCDLPRQQLNRAARSACRARAKRQ